MHEITPFKFDNQDVRVITDENGEPLFVGKDICEALGYADPTTAIRSHCRGVQKLHPIPDSLGRMQETRMLSEPDVMRLMTNSTMPEAEKFERLVFEEILPTIRRTGSYSAAKKPSPDTSIPATKEFRALYGIARLIGLDKNIASISANQATFKITGTNVLSLLGSTHLDNPDQVMFYTPTELGKMFGGVSARQMNMLLADAGLQAKKGEHWAPMATAEGFCRILDTGKKHGDGAAVQQVKWAESVLTLIKKEQAA